MNSTVALVGVGTHGDTALGSRIGAFCRGLTLRGWHVTVVDPPLPHTTVAERLLEHTPAGLRSMLQHAGAEGDVRPVAGWRVRRALRGVVAVIYAGAPTLGDRLIRHLRLPPNRVISVPNGFDTADLDGLSGAQVRPERNGQPLRLLMNGYWYGRNGPGILTDALQHVGPAVAQLTVIGGVSPPIATHITQATGRALVPVTAMSRRELYECLERADAAVVTLDHASAVESRIPAKIYDYLATGVPVLAVCPPGAALLQIPEARRFHHVHHRDLNALVTLLRKAMRDRATLRTGRLGEGPTPRTGC